MIDPRPLERCLCGLMRRDLPAVVSELREVLGGESVPWLSRVVSEWLARALLNSPEKVLAGSR